MNEYVGNVYSNEKEIMQPRACIINLCGGDSSSSCTGNFCSVNQQDKCFFLSCSSN